MISASDVDEAASALARPATRLSVRLLTRGPMVGTMTVSPSPNSAVKPTQAIRPAEVRGSPATEYRPGNGEDQAGRDQGVAAPHPADGLQHDQLGGDDDGVLTVMDSATTRADTCPSTVAKAGRAESKAGSW